MTGSDCSLLCHTATHPVPPQLHTTRNPQDNKNGSKLRATTTVRMSQVHKDLLYASQVPKSQVHRVKCIILIAGDL